VNFLFNSVFLQYDVQAAPPLRDSGNDLVAVRCKTFKTIQVKTTVLEAFTIDFQKLPDFYDLLALVHLDGEASDVLLDYSKIFLIPKEVVDTRNFPRNLEELCKSQFVLNRDCVDALFPERHFQFYGKILNG